MQYVIGVDIGGTCTDSVVVDEGGDVTFGKAFSTPPDFSAGIIDSLHVAASALELELPTLLANTRLFLHSTTVAENAVTDGTLSRTGLLTTRGFEDTLFATRGGYGRYSGLTDDEKRNPVYTDKLPTIVPRSMVRGIHERADYKGARLVEADAQAIETAAQELVEQGAEALGVSFLWSFTNPENEILAAETIRRLYPDKFLTVSHEIAPILGEYERTSTVVLNSALGPVVKGYLGNLKEKLAEQGFAGTLSVAQAYGGLLPFDKAADRPVGMIESGPVSGLVGSKALGEKIGYKNIIAADMGGTTYKVGVIREGLIEYQRESMVYRYHFALPKMDVVSLGLAGGSIIAVDPRTNVPHVGPASAGSYPGPICYDHGGLEPTITDVDGLLGYLNPAYFLGGRKDLNLEKARRIFQEKVADPLGLPLVDAAAAMHRLANSMIYDLLHKVTIERGIDPREFALFSFGGTAGMHVAAYGTELGVRCIVVPHSAAVHGAFGLVSSDVVHEDQMTHPLRVPADLQELSHIYDTLTKRVLAELREEGFAGDDVLLSRSMDMRYRRQVHILNVPVTQADRLTEEAVENTIARFEQLYEGKYGKDSAFREAGMEMVAFRVRGTGLVKKPELRVVASGGEDPSAAFVEHRPAYVAATGRLELVAGYDFERLAPGNVVPGPAIIWTPITTVVVNPDQRAQVDKYKNLIIAGRG